MIKDTAPAGSILAALKYSDADKLFIKSSDMPFIKREAIQYNITKASPAQITLPLNHGTREPLFSSYSKKCFPFWHEFIQQEKIKLQEMVTYFELLEINVEEKAVFTDSFFTNINDESDFKKALKQVQHGN